MDARELAIRRNQTHKILGYPESRLKFIDRDIRHAGNDHERDRLECVRKELDKWRCSMRVEIARLKQDEGLVDGGR